MKDFFSPELPAKKLKSLMHIETRYLCSHKREHLCCNSGL